MRKLVCGLILTNLAFAASTLYLWRELARAQRELPAGTQVSSLPTTAPESHPSPVATQAVVADSAVKPAGRGGDIVSVKPEADAYQQAKKSLLASSKAFLVQVADPAMRKRLLEQARGSVRGMFPGLASYLGLRSDEYERLLDTLAEGRLQEREAMSHCVVDPACDLREQQRDGARDLSSQVADALGPERAQRFEVYEQSLTQREMVLQLRARLPDQAYLSSELAETLINGLAEEAWQAGEEARQSGLTYDGFGVDTGWVSYVNEGSPEQKMASAEKYVRRMRERAAQVLNADQLAVFDQMQANTLANLRALLDKRSAHELANR